MLTFMTPQIWEALIWANIIVGCTWAAVRLYRDLSGPPRFTDDDSLVDEALSSLSNGPSGPSPNA